MPNASGTNSVPRPCHRHWVIVPLFLSVVVVSSFLSRYEERLVGAPETFPKGEDEVLLRDDGMITFHWNNFSLYGMHGAFTVSTQAGHVSIAALTTPVLVRGGEAWSIVPVGFQWRSDERSNLLPLPLAFQYAKLQELSDASSSPPLPRWDPSLILPGTLRFPAAKQRHEDMVRMQHLSTVARQIARGRPLTHMVQDDAMVAALSSRDGYRILPSLLAELTDAPLDRAALFPFLFQEEEGTLLALFHPTFRDHAALLETGALSPEARAVYHVSFPRSDLLPRALSQLALSRWEEGLTEELLERPDALRFFTTLLDTIEDVVRECVRHGYVERAERYIEVVQHLSSFVELTPELQERLEDLPHLLTVPASVSPLISSSVSLAPQSSSSASDVGSKSSVSLLSVVEDPEPAEWEDLREHATRDLTAQGGMFTSQTTIEPVSPTVVRIASLVLATSVGDELLDFTYDTERQEVSDILRGSTRYPYAVPLAQFVEWVRRE